MMSSLFAGHPLGGFFERTQRLAPEFVEPPSEGLDATCIYVIKPACPFSPDRDQPRRSQHLEVLRNSGAGNAHSACQLAGIVGALAQPHENTTARSVPQRIKSAFSVDHRISRPVILAWRQNDSLG
jgi:hypothetical protein